MPQRTQTLEADERSTYLAEEARRCDPDRYLCALFSPAGRRDTVLGLILFNHELARIPEVVSQPMAGMIRYQWWRDALDEISAGKPARQHPIVSELAVGDRARVDRRGGAAADDRCAGAGAGGGRRRRSGRDRAFRRRDQRVACRTPPTPRLGGLEPAVAAAAQADRDRVRADRHHSRGGPRGARPAAGADRAKRP